jgi:hypothetical protein
MHVACVGEGVVHEFWSHGSDGQVIRAILFLSFFRSTKTNRILQMENEQYMVPRPSFPIFAQDGQRPVHHLHHSSLPLAIAIVRSERSRI